MNDPLQVAQLLCTRLCHDLAGPFGAVSAGVELMGTDPSLIDDETLNLLSGSAEAASRKLKFLRIAFGWVGSGSTSLDQLGQSLEEYLIATSGPSGGPTLVWPEPNNLDPFGQRLGDQAAQILANISLLGFEVQPACKTLSVKASQSEEQTSISVLNKPSRDSVSMREDIVRLVGDTDSPDMSPLTVHAYLVRELVALSGGRIDITNGADGVLTTASWT